MTVCSIVVSCGCISLHYKVLELISKREVRVADVFLINIVKSPGTAQERLRAASIPPSALRGKKGRIRIMAMATGGLPIAGTTMEPRHFRRVCSRFASGVTIVTVIGPDGALHGMTASSFTSVSMRPPLILVCVNAGTKILDAFSGSNHFGVNVLSDSQRRLSERFAGSGYDRFDGMGWYPGRTGVPLFPDVLATLECTRVSTTPAGDHEILLGEVNHAECRDGEPLVHFGSQYRGLEAAHDWWSTL